MELLEIELKVKVKLKVAKMILAILRPSAAWDSTVTRGGLEIYFSVTGQGRKPRPGQGRKSRPGLGSLPWPAPLRAPFTRGPSGRPSHAWSTRLSTAGRNDQWNFEFHLHFQFDLKELHDEGLETFFAGDTKENCKSLKLVSVHDRNKASINKYRGSFLLKLLWTILIVLLYIFINLLRTETTGNLSDFR